MIGSPHYARAAGKLLADRDQNQSLPPPAEDARARAIAAIERAVLIQHRRRRARVVVTALAAAAVVLLSVGAGRMILRARSAPKSTVATTTAPASPANAITATGHVLTGDVVATRDGQSFSLAQGASLVPGDRVVAADNGRGALMLSTGTQLLVEGGGTLAIVEQTHTQSYSLESGAVRAFVAKLGAADRFLVRTGDAEIEVRGTSFRVMRATADAACGGTTTRVDVFEGVVVVRAGGKEDRVVAGERWPRGCTWTTVEMPPPQPTTPTTPSGPSFTAKAPSVAAKVLPPNVSPSTVASSELGVQNAMFAEAIAAKRRGDSAGAVQGFERFLTKYPASALAESAAAERLRLLTGIDRGRAVTAAKEYLARYPKGSARAEAQELISPKQ